MCDEWRERGRERKGQADVIGEAREGRKKIMRSWPLIQSVSQLVRSRERDPRSTTIAADACALRRGREKEEESAQAIIFVNTSDIPSDPHHHHRTEGDYRAQAPMRSVIRSNRQKNERTNDGSIPAHFFSSRSFPSLTFPIDRSITFLPALQSIPLVN